MKVYADTSFIVALYLQQERSATAAAFMRRHGQALPFTPWHRLEVRNALRLAVFQGGIDSRQAKTQLKQIDEDLKEHTIIVHASVDWVSVLREAENLGAKHNEVIGCRSGDVFHIAAAVEMDADLFMTFDERQAKLAKAAGLVLKNLIF